MHTELLLSSLSSANNDVRRFSLITSPVIFVSVGFPVLMHLQEESCAPPPPECKDQAFVPERSTRNEVSLLVQCTRAIISMLLSCGVLFLHCHFQRGFTVMSFFSSTCCMKRRSIRWSIGSGCHRQSISPMKGKFSAICRRCKHLKDHIHFIHTEDNTC